jgi:ADP-ribosylglycohydrolase
MTQSPDKHSRKKGALWGMFVGDALAMPVHWYYNRRALKADYGRVTDYRSPKNPHPDSILWRSSYTPVNAKGDILHDQSQYWGKKGVHYHQFLQAGENTLNIKICRLLVRRLLDNGVYDADAYLNDYIDFMTIPGTHRDTYIEEYHRYFFTNYANGKHPRACGAIEKHISGIIGMVPLIVHYADDPDVARQLSLEHLHLTHLGSRMTAAGQLLLDILIPVLHGKSLFEVIAEKLYQQNNRLLGFPLIKWLDEPDENVVGRRLSTACYVEDAIPATIFLALKYHDDPAEGLIANTNLGGDNAGRGAVLGALLGAANGFEAWPASWIDGLCHPPPDIKLEN